MTKLLPCPFCGGKASWFENAILGGHMAVCRNPNCQAQGRLSGDKEKAARAWNRRPSAADLAQPTEGAQSDERRLCNACDWVGPLSECVMCGDVGPLCPACQETTEGGGHD